uniref:Ig-like domain-containing protein n=1 Tax=Myripristis murdjan TaxID=586833 RepID=A0A667YEH2_9TELE
MKTIMWLGFVLAALSAGGEEFIVKRGQTITIKCGGSSKDSPKTLETIKTSITDNQICGGDTAKRSRLTQNNLLIQNVQDTDAGAYTCYLDHKPHKHKLYVLSVSLSPNNELQQGSEATLQCDVSGLDVPPTVEWESPQKTLEGSETVQLKPVETSHAGLWTCKISHGESVQARSRLDQFVGFVGFVFDSLFLPPSVIHYMFVGHPNATEKFNEKPQLLLGLSMWMWIAIGLGSLALVVLVVFVIVLDRKIKKRRVRKLSQKSVKTSLPCPLYHSPTAAAPPPQGQRRVKPSAPPLQQR